MVGYKDFLLSEELEHTTIDRHLSTLKSVFRWLTEDAFYTVNPAEGVRFLSPRRLSKTQGFSNEEVIRVLNQPNLHSRVGTMHYAILTILFYCGLRRSEVVALRTTNFSTERGQRVMRLRGKGNSERILPLISRVWNAIDLYSLMTGRPMTGDRFLFSPLKNNRTGDLTKALDPSMIFRIVQKYARMAGVQGRVSPHSCRATAISNARDHKAPDRAIQEFAGWTSPNMIIHYDKRRTAIEESAAHAIKYDRESKDLEKSDSDLGSERARGRPFGSS
jgi:integrase